jgi:beta-lactamase superfamily II metal-dependent hydrolase
MPPKKRRLTELEKLLLEAKSVDNMVAVGKKRQREREELEEERQAELAAQSANKRVKKPKPNDSAKYAPPNEKKRSGDRDVDGNLHLYFMAMGQGDCTILVTPLGKVIIIDMGSDSIETGKKDSDDVLRAVLKQDNVLGQNSSVEAVIITHSDSDHNNYLWMLKNVGGSAQRIYHSNTFEKYDKGSRGASDRPNVDEVMQSLRATAEDFRVNGVSFTSTRAKPIPPPNFTDIYNMSFADLYTYYMTNTPHAPAAQYQSMLDTAKQTTNLGQKSTAPKMPNPVKYKTAPPVFAPYYQPTLVDNTGKVTTQGKGMVIYSEPTCTVRILVANYRDYHNCYRLSQPGNNKPAGWRIGYNTRMAKNLMLPRVEKKPEDVNRASIVVHIEHTPAGKPTENYVICGDATYEPLQMIIDEYDLANVTILQAPHHGAESFGSVHEKFFTKMKPKIAVYSSPYYSFLHCHPRAVSIEAMKKAMTTDPKAKTNYGCWRRVALPLKGKQKKPKYAFSYQKNLNVNYRIYVTGWMQERYYHYQSPFDTKSNYPEFLSGDSVKVGIPPQKTIKDED